MIISMINKSTDKPILTLSAFTTLFLLPLSLTKKNKELNKLIIISANKNKNIIFNIIKSLPYVT